MDAKAAAANVQQAVDAAFTAADVVIMALGFDQDKSAFLKEAGVNQGKWGEVTVDQTSFMTSMNNIFAGGDCQRGADLVVTAAADGRKAALQIMQQLLG